MQIGEAIAERLRRAMGEGRLLAEELEERLEAVFAARTYGELDAVVADLPAPWPRREPARPARRQVSVAHRRRRRRGGDVRVAGANRGGDRDRRAPAFTGFAAIVVPCRIASGGIGGVTIGHYGANIGGPALALGKGPYFQVYRSAGSTFTKIEYKDCELGGATTLWWDDPATGWEPISEPTAVYDQATHCVTVTATANSRPSVAQLSDPRHVGGPTATEEYGKCVPAKHAHFEDGACTKEKFKEKNGVRSYKGKYEWMPSPVACYPQKHGRYSDSGCTVLDEKKGKPKGKYEAGQSTFTGSGGSATLEAVGAAGVECQGSTSTGTLRAPNEALLQITFTGCTSESGPCNSQGQTGGEIVTEPLESYTYEESSSYFTVLAGSPIMSFSCAHGRLTLSGAAGGQLTAAPNTSITTSESAFRGGLGEQELVLEEAQGRIYPATLSSVFHSTDTQPLELRAKP